MINRAIERTKLIRENRLLKEEIGLRYDFSSIIGRSPATREIISLIKKVSLTKSTVLITGESGTGKELVAKAIHYNSRRAGKLLVTVNCGAIPENLLESELFGYVKGAFTGAGSNRRGLFEQAIATLGEALDRYSDDPRVWRARYLIADSYRRSGLALKEEMAEAAFSGELKQMQTASTTRFQKARKLYRGLITAYELRDPGELNRLEQLYLRHAYLYEADCHFETQDYRVALRLYEDAAGTLKDHPAGLAAYVQIINCHVFLGEPNEARAALARAKIMAGAIPEEAFVQSVSPERREDWQQYFDWLGESGLF